MSHGSDLEAMLGRGWREAARARRREIVARVGGRSDVVLFGTGALGRSVRRELESLPLRAVAFVDNDRDRWGTEVDGLPVMSPDDAAARLDPSTLWLITIYTNRSVIAQCRRMDVPWVTCAELSWVLATHPPSFVFGEPEELASARVDIEAASGIWSDDVSTAEYASQVRWRFLLDYDSLAAPRPAAETYFPDDLIRPSTDDVFVDVGAFTGDTIETFIHRKGGRFKGVVGIEPDAVNRAAMAERFARWDQTTRDRIRVEPVAAGAERGTTRFEATGTVRSSVGAGTEYVDVAPLDELLAHDQATYLAFDVEGAERDALTGAARVIKEDRPVLAVCLYHKPHDLWDLPLLVRSLSPDYRLYLRRYSDERWETVLYAVPAHRVLT